MKRRAIIILACIFAVALGLRLFYLTQLANQPLTGDSPGYDNIAWNLAQGHGYRYTLAGADDYTAKRGPSHILFMAAIYYLTDHSTTAVRVVQVLLDLISCFLVFRIALLLFKRDDYALLSATMYAVYPPIWKQAPAIVTEPFVNLAFMVALFAALSFYMAGKKWGLIACGVAIGIGALSKPIMGALPVIIAISAWGTQKTRKQELLLPAISIVIMMLIFAPWWVRNGRVFHRFVPTLTSGGIAFWGGTGPNNGEVVGGRYGSDVPQQVRDAAARLDEYHLDKWFYEEGKRVISSSPGRFAVLALKKGVSLWFGPAIIGKGPGVFTMCLNLILVALAAYGIARARPPKLPIRLLIILAVCYTAVHMVFFSDLRYVLPIYAYMFSFAAAGGVAACVSCRCRLQAR